MSKTYAIADLHGRHDLLLQALYAIRDYDYDLGRPGGTIVTMGDYIDRGPQSRQVIETLMAGLDPLFGEDNGFDLVSLHGNHENIMIASFILPHLTTEWWIPNGGGPTLASYGAQSGMNLETAWNLVPEEHIRWMDGLPRMHVDQHRVFVHAGVQPDIPLDEQVEEKLIWMIYPEGAEDGHGDRHVVHGHHQFEDGPKVFAGRTDLDTCAWYTGRLVVGVFDDEVAGGAVDFIEVLGPHIHQLRQKLSDASVGGQGQ